jgi:Domain of unknown function (DUF4338)
MDNMITKEEKDEYIVNGRKLSEEDLKQIIEMVRIYPGLTIEELVKTICVVLRWNSFVGTKKEDGVEELLQNLEIKGMIKLTNLHHKKHGKWRYERNGKAKNMKPIEITEKTLPGKEMFGLINSFFPVNIEIASDTEKETLWNEYIERYHELKYGSPFGDRLKYFITMGGENPQYVGCIMFSASAWALEGRDRWIGWTKADRMLRLKFVVNNTRLLIFPWIKIKNLASWSLGEVRKRIRKDWWKRHKYEPVLLETFVDAAKYEGVCYKAANWIYVGNSKGIGRHSSEKHYVTTPKRIFMYPLVEDFRDYLTGKKSVGGVIW